MRFPPQTASYHIDSTAVKIHAISTGSVKVKKKFRETKLKGMLGLVASFFTTKFTEWMPILVWVIEHPEGTFVIDTGENAKVNNPDYFKSSGWFNNWLNTSQFEFEVSREEEIDRQLMTLGINSLNIKLVLMTHLHLDHFDGLHHFPDTPVIVHDLEWEKPVGALPKLYPQDFSPRLVQLTQALGPFDKALPITQDKKLWMVHTPGHTHGQCSFILLTDEHPIFFAADVCYYQEQLEDYKFAGGNVSHKKARQTYDRIHEYHKKQPLIFLPSHDAAAGSRLEQKQTM